MHIVHQFFAYLPRLCDLHIKWDMSKSLLILQWRAEDFPGGREGADRTLSIFCRRSRLSFNRYTNQSKMYAPG